MNNTYDETYRKMLHEVNQRVTWDSATVASLNLEPIIYQDMMHDVNVLKQIYQRVIRYGFAKIEQVPSNIADTRLAIERVCRMTHTVFGTFWETGTNFDHKDTGYLNGFLEAHTDTTYFTEAQGYVF